MKTLAWHFTNGWKLRDGRPLVIGKTYVHTGPARMCESGLHASRMLLDAICYAPGTVISRVECWGIVDKDRNKIVCTHRRVLDAIDAEYLLHDLACVFAEHVLGYNNVEDDRMWGLIKAKRDWLAGEINTAALNTARHVARRATRHAAWHAALGSALNTVRNTTWRATWNVACCETDAAWGEMNTVAEDHILSHMAKGTL